MSTSSCNLPYSKFSYNPSDEQLGLNNQIFRHHLNRIWPNWVYQQFQPDSDQFQPSISPLHHLNSTNRSWTLLSCPANSTQFCVDTHGLITPLHFGWSCDFWIGTSEHLVSAAWLSQTHQQMDFDNQTLSTTFNVNQLSITIQVCIDYQHDDHPLRINASIKNTDSSPLSLSFYAAIRPYNPLGVSPVQAITYMTDHKFIVNNDVGLILNTPPQNVVCTNFDDGDISEHFRHWEMILNTKCQKNLASAIAEYRLELDSNQDQQLGFTIPSAQLSQTTKKPSNQGFNQLAQRLKTDSSFDDILSKNTEFWSQLTRSLGQISCANQSLNQALQQSQRYLLSIIDTPQSIIQDNQLRGAHFFSIFHALNSYDSEHGFFNDLLTLSKQIKSLNPIHLAHLIFLIHQYLTYLFVG